VKRSSAYVPDRGDAVWLTFDPQSGHEQSGRCPAIVLSPRAYNSRTHLAIFCSVTTQSKGYPFEVEIPPDLPLDGIILADQVRNLDWKSRRASKICDIPPETMDEILGKLETLLAR
jgi:mRNA interferase MazF